MLIQQGDVIIESVGQVEGKRTDNYVLAKGEATGHHHSVRVADREQVEMYEKDGTLYMRVVGKEAIIEHQEHKEVVIPQGDWAIRQVREYDHFTEEAKRVVD